MEHLTSGGQNHSDRPVSDRYVPEALKVTGLSLERLRSDGLDPDEAMQRFKVWVEQVTPEGARAVFVGFNASFDWSFVNHYFHYFLGENPFGIAALDIKSMYFGAARSTWEQTRSSEIAQTVNPARKVTMTLFMTRFTKPNCSG